MTSKDRVKIVRSAGYCGYDQPLDSKCDHPEKYAVMRIPEVELLINASDRDTAPHKAFRLKPYKHTFMLSESQEGLMHKARRLLGNGRPQARVQFVIEKALTLLFEQMEAGNAI